MGGHQTKKRKADASSKLVSKLPEKRTYEYKKKKNRTTNNQDQDNTKSKFESGCECGVKNIFMNVLKKHVVTYFE